MGVGMTIAKDLLWPTDTKIVFRFVFLYVGQGSSTLVIFRDGTIYRALLVDINLDEGNGGINVPILMKDLLGKDDLFAFVNSHPHDDHLKGIGELTSKVNVKQVWHSGHTPGKKHAGDTWKELQALIKKVKEAKGTEVVLLGSKNEESLGDGKMYVLAPAEYVSDEIDDEDVDTRRQRIHEQCSVLRIGLSDTWVLLPGDADKPAFEKFITKYHKDRLKSAVLLAPHHGSRSFFKSDEDDEPYLAAIESIAPEYVILSAPKSVESQHDHPHDDAIEIYQAHVGSKDDVLHTGAERQCFICDIFEDGNYTVEDDKGELVKAYGLGKKDDGGGDGSKAASIGVISSRSRTRVDDRPMGE
jgi:beta-lactamase superfamily II metal-dependent hydrolase